MSKPLSIETRTALVRLGLQVASEAEAARAKGLQSEAGILAQVANRISRLALPVPLRTPDDFDAADAPHTGMTPLATAEQAEPRA